VLPCAVGPFELVKAGFVQRGDLFPVLTNTSDPPAGFTVAVVDDVTVVQADGMYLPMIEKSFIIAEDVVVPL
jgi:hypothetical protein